MADRSRTILKIIQKIGLLNVAEFGEVTVSLNDTVTFDTMTTLTNSFFIRLDTGAVITSTQATNQATITGASTDERCIYIAYGER